MNNTRKPSLEHLEDRNLMSTTSITWTPATTFFPYGTKLGPAELNASVYSNGYQNPPVTNLVYLDQNGNSVGYGTILPVGIDTITAQYGQYAIPVARMFTVAPAPLASPALTPVSPQTTTIQTTVNGVPTLGVTALLSGGNQETGTLAFTLQIIPQNHLLPSYTVTPALVNVQGDGFYSASYTIPAGLAGTYTWTATYNGDASNSPVGPTNLGTVTVQVTPAPLASPSLTSASPQTTTIQTTVNGASTLSVTALLSGGNQETGTLAFTLKITPQNTIASVLYSHTCTGKYPW